MDQARKQPRGRVNRADPHSMPYPNRLHAHLSAAADAAATLAAVEAPEQVPGSPGPADQGGASEGVKATESEVTDNG